MSYPDAADHEHPMESAAAMYRKVRESALDLHSTFDGRAENIDQPLLGDTESLFGQLNGLAHEYREEMFEQADGKWNEYESRVYACWCESGGAHSSYGDYTLYAFDDDTGHLYEFGIRTGDGEETVDAAPIHRVWDLDAMSEMDVPAATTRTAWVWTQVSLGLAEHGWTPADDPDKTLSGAWVIPEEP